MANPPLEVASAEPASVAGFRKWLQRHGAWIHPHLRFVADDTGMSVVANEPIPADSPVLSCPFDLAITAESAGSALKNAFGDLLDARFEQLSERQKILSYIVMHYTSKKYGQHLKHQPYLDTLPSGKLMTPLYFTEPEKLFLVGSNMYEAARERDTDWESEMDEARRVFFRVPQMNQAFTWAQWLQAATWLSSRAFPSSLLSLTDPSASAATSHPVLLPAIDCLNHKRNHPVTWQTSTESPSKAPLPVEGSAKGFIILVHHPAAEHGQQVYNNYGPKPNSELLLGYGFTISRNPDDTILLKLHKGSRRSIGRDPLTIIPLWNEVLELLRQRSSEQMDEEDEDNEEKITDEGQQQEKGKEEDQHELQSNTDHEVEASHEQPEELGEWEEELEAADVLRQMVTGKLQALPNVTGHRPENLRPGVWRNIKHYVGGQKDILEGILDFCDAKETAVVEAARNAGVDFSYGPDE